MRLLWRNVLFGVLGFWLLLLVYMSLTLFHTNDRGEATDRTQRQLNDALRQLDDLKQENKKLYVLAKQLQREMSQNKQPRLNSSSSHSSSAHDLAPLVDLAEGHGLLAPSQTHEVLQRAVENGVREQWYYMRSQLGKLRKDISAKTSSVESWLSTLDDVMNTGADYRRALLRDLHNLTSLSGDWRKQESEELSKIVQERIYHTQNPKDCSTARKLVCNLNKGCGYGCQLHHVVYCFLVAHGTGRTMILESNNWRYSSGGWEKYFLPVSDTCTDKSGSISKAWGPNVDDIQVVMLPIVDSLMPRPAYMPQAIPADLVDRLVRLHGHPFVWWVGQFLKFLLRPQPSLAADMKEVAENLNFKNPIVGVHIRRTDKVHSEAAFHGLDEYMVHVEEYFNQLDAQNKMASSEFTSLYDPVKRRVYLATDDPTVLDEAKKNYRHYEFVSDPGFSRSAGLGSRYSDMSLRGVLLDIHFLSLSDYLVCTFSSQVCRVAYEIMQTLHPDASSYFTSLDDIYYFGGQNGHNQVAIADHKARPGAGEIDLNIGDVVGIAGNHWDGFSKGLNKRTGLTGIYPSYKVREKLETANFPTKRLEKKIKSQR